MKKLFQLGLIISCFFSVNKLLAQETTMTARFRAATIDSVLRLLKEKYAYPEIALKKFTTNQINSDFD